MSLKSLTEFKTLKHRLYSKKAYELQQNHKYLESLRFIAKISQPSYFDLRIKHLCEKSLGRVDLAIKTIHSMDSKFKNLQEIEIDTVLSLFAQKYPTLNQLKDSGIAKDLISQLDIKSLVLFDDLLTLNIAKSQLFLEQTRVFRKSIKYVGEQDEKSMSNEAFGRDRFLLEFENSFILSESHWIIKDQYAYHDYGSDKKNGDEVKVDSDKPCKAKFDSSELLFDLEKYREVNIKNGLWLGGWGSSEFGHFIQSLAPKINLLDNLQIPPKFPLILDAKTPHNIILIVKQLTNRDLLYLEAQSIARVEKLYFITDSIFCPVHLNAKLLENEVCPLSPVDLEKIRSKTYTSGGLPTKKIYLTRKSSKWRLITNEKKIEKYLEKKGFQIYDLSELKLPEIQQLFLSAKCIISPLSSGILNVIYSPPQTNFYIIIGRLYNEEYLAGAFDKLNMNIEFIRGVQFDKQQRHSDLFVPMINFKRSIRNILKEV